MKGTRADDSVPFGKGVMPISLRGISVSDDAANREELATRPGLANQSSAERTPRNVRALRSVADPTIILPDGDWPNAAEQADEIMRYRGASKRQQVIADRPVSQQQHADPTLLEVDGAVTTPTKSSEFYVVAVTDEQEPKTCTGSFSPGDGPRGVFFRSKKDPTKGRWGAFRCRQRGCPVHGGENRVEAADHMGGKFGNGGCYVVEVQPGQEWDRLRQRLHRAGAHGYKIPIEGGGYAVVNDYTGQWVDSPEITILEYLDIEARDGRRLSGLGGWKVATPRPGADKWTPELVSEMSRVQIHHNLHEAGYVPEDVPDDDMPDGFVDAMEFTMPAREDPDWPLFVQLVGGIEWEEWLALRGKRRRRDDDAEAVAA